MDPAEFTGDDSVRFKKLMTEAFTPRVEAELRRLIIDFGFVPVRPEHAAEVVHRVSRINLDLLDHMIIRNGLQVTAAVSDGVMRRLLSGSFDDALLQPYFDRGFVLSATTIKIGLRRCDLEALRTIRSHIPERELRISAEEVLAETFDVEFGFSAGLVDFLIHNFSFTEDNVAAALLRSATDEDRDRRGRREATTLPDQIRPLTKCYHQTIPNIPWRWVLRTYGPTHRFSRACLLDAITRIPSSDSTVLEFISAGCPLTPDCIPRAMMAASGASISQTGLMQELLAHLRRQIETTAGTMMEWERAKWTEEFEIWAQLGSGVSGRDSAGGLGLMKSATVGWRGGGMDMKKAWVDEMPRLKAVLEKLLANEKQRMDMAHRRPLLQKDVAQNKPRLVSGSSSHTTKRLRPVLNHPTPCLRVASEPPDCIATPDAPVVPVAGQPPTMRTIPKPHHHVTHAFPEHDLINHDQISLFDTDPMWRACFQGDLAQFIIEARRPSSLEPGLTRGECERSGEGETVLHVAVLLGHIDIVNWILKEWPGKLVNEIYLMHRYFGETALHIAAAKGRLDLVKILLKEGADVNGPLVRGTEFLKDKDRGVLYYGQTILQFAACTNNFDIVKFLVEEGNADLTTVDLYGKLHAVPSKPSIPESNQKIPGNNVLHVIAFYGRFDLELYRYLMAANLKDIAAMRTTINITQARNKENLSPFQVGISQGHAIIIDTIKETIWEFGFVRQYRVPLLDLDPVQPHYIEPGTGKNRSKTSRVSKSALEIAVEREDKIIISHPLFDALLRVKWALYGRRKFLMRLILTLLLICCFTVSVALQPDDIVDRRHYFNIRESGGRYTQLTQYFRLGFEAVTIIGTVGMISAELRDVIVQGLAYFTGYGSGENVIQWMFSVFVWLIPVIRFAISPHVGDDVQITLRDCENVIMGLGGILGWFYMLNFAKGFSSLGPLTLIFRRILLGDLLEWLALYITFTMGFSVAFYLQMNGVPAATTEEPIPVLDWNQLPGALLWTVRFIFAQAVFDDFRKAKLPAFTELLFVTYGFLTLVLLVNVLIAKLTETFKSIALDSRRAWRVQWAYLIMEMDERLSERERNHLLSHLGVMDRPRSSSSFDKNGRAKDGNGSTASTEPQDARRYFLFTERDTIVRSGEGKDNQERVVSQPIKLVVAQDPRSGNDVEIRTDLDHWEGWGRDLLPPRDKTFLWVEHSHTFKGDSDVFKMVEEQHRKGHGHGHGRRAPAASALSTVDDDTITRKDFKDLSPNVSSVSINLDRMAEP
ncbi:Transient receptor putative cation channel sub V member 6 [Irineochytrium annulatum]|nr:Transient receptor putative cation channel sub V member 6 [Irineochytrium annulatum]